mgnify:CR=1 FL=1
MQAGVEFVGGAGNSALGGPLPEAKSRPETPVESLVKGLRSFPGSRVRNVLFDTYTLNGPESLSFISPEPLFSPSFCREYSMSTVLLFESLWACILLNSRIASIIICQKSSVSLFEWPPGLRLPGLASVSTD